MLVKFLNWCIHHGVFYEQGRNWCDCVKYSTFVNFWKKEKVHTFYAMDDGSFKVDNMVVNDIKDIERTLGLNYEEDD